MTHVTSRAALLAAVLLALAGAPGARAATPAVTPPLEAGGSPGGHTFTRTAEMVPVMDGPDGTHAATIDTDLYLPDSATAGTPQPLIVMTHGFGLDKSSNEMVSNATFFAQHGYVVLAFTAQGFGASSGCVRLDSADYEGKDVIQLVDHLAANPAIDTRHFGMVGGSYGGGLHGPTAGVDPRLAAVVSGRTWDTLQFSLDPNHYVDPADPTHGDDLAFNAQGVFKQLWTTLFFALGNSAPQNCEAESLAAATSDPTQATDVACPGFSAAVCTTYVDVTTGTASASDKALLARAARQTFIAHQPPTLLVQGQQDTLFNETEAAATYRQLDALGTPVSMIWNSGGHGGYDSQPGECEVYDGTLVTDGSECYLMRRTLTWLDRYVRDLPVDTGPRFSWYDFAHPSTRPTYASALAAYGNASTYPAPDHPVVTYTLSGADALVTDGATPGSAMMVNPGSGKGTTYTETSNETGGSGPAAGLPTMDGVGEVADFTTAPFTVDTEVVGVPTATIDITNTVPQDLEFFARLKDVAPDGTSTVLRRLIAPVRVPQGTTGKVTFTLDGYAALIPAGHSLALSLAATDLTSLSGTLPDVLDVTTGPGNTFSVPERPVTAAAAPAAPVLTPEQPTPVVAPVVAPPAATGALPTTGLAGWPVVLGIASVAAAAVVRRRRARC